MFGKQGLGDWPCCRLLGQAMQVFVSEQAVGGCGPCGGQDLFPGMETGQTEDSLDQTQSPHAPFFESCFCPLAQGKSY